jgi:hypothetical protein
MSGTLGPLGSDAVVMIGAFASSATLASTTVFALEFGDKDVLDGLEQTGLVINQKQDGVIGIEENLGGGLAGLARESLNWRPLGVCFGYEDERRCNQQDGGIHGQEKLEGLHK